MNLLKPVGRSRWGMAAWLAAGLGATLVVSAVVGHTELGSAVALGFVLTAVPAIPLIPREAMSTIAIRGITVSVGAVVALATAHRPSALAAAIVAAALLGGLFDRIGPSAGLAVVLVAIDAPSTVLPYMAGAAIVAVAWTGWYCFSRVWRRQAGRPPAEAAPQRPFDFSAAYPHALRVGVAVGAAVAIARLLPPDLVGGHWLITCVLLTVQPVAADTGVRLAQRLLGNSVGTLIAALVLGMHPSVPDIAVLTMVLFTLAMALRPVNYTWWAVTGPPVLLVISEYPALFPWYEGGVRLAMNVAGGVIVVVVIFGVPALGRTASRVRRGDFLSNSESDSVSKIQRRRLP